MPWPAPAPRASRGIGYVLMTAIATVIFFGSILFNLILLIAVAGSADEVAWSADVAACRRVLEAHGGTLEVEPSDKGGFHFHLELPIAAAGAGATP